MKKRALFLDWDGVVSDYTLLKRRLFESAELYGVAREKIRPIYDETKIKNSYNHRNFSERIAQLAKVSVDDVYATLLQVFQKSNEYIFHEIKELLDANREYFDYYVVSAGDEWLQRYKVTSSGLERYFSDITIVSGIRPEQIKLDYIESVRDKYERCFFFDDRLDTIVSAHEKWRAVNDVVPIWVDRYGRIPAECENGFIVTDLTQESCDFINPLYDRGKTLIAGAVVRNNDSVLLVKETSGASRGLLSLPIGHVDGDDTYEQTAARELLEETGFVASELQQYALLAVRGENYGGSDYDKDRMIVICLHSASVGLPSRDAEHHFAWKTLPEINTKEVRGSIWQYPLISHLIKS